MNRREFDASFKRMAIDLSYARGSVKEVAEELGIDPGRLSKWRQKDRSPVPSTKGLTKEQQEIKRLQQELKEAQLERDILKSVYSAGAVEWPIQPFRHNP
ncbi:transposase [Pontibacter beigongshangensis]|uniref:transposase n=1 Tax=Pontibacter beigongshangensis TaxID=2574733 RepID=UPI001650AA5B|nr:transposase [Pontibacter beigongshangensis]